MKSIKVSLLLLPLLAVIILIQAVAFEPGSTSVTLGKPTMVSGKELQPGEYKLKWVPGSSDCQATLYRRGKPVAEFRGRLVDRDTKAPATAVAAVTGPDGKPVIKEIRIGGTTTVLVVE